MTHEQWLARLRRSLAMVEHHPAQALKSPKTLAGRLESAASQRVGDWHVAQTLEALSIVQSHLEDHQHSAETILRVAEHHERQISYSARAFVSACATAAMEFATAGDRAAAVRALNRASPIAATLHPAERLFRKAEELAAATPPRGSRRANKRLHPTAAPPADQAKTV